VRTVALEKVGGADTRNAGPHYHDVEVLDSWTTATHHLVLPQIPDSRDLPAGQASLFDNERRVHSVGVVARDVAQQLN
jgi:hypothetical protein